MTTTYVTHYAHHMDLKLLPLTATLAEPEGFDSLYEAETVLLDLLLLAAIEDAYEVDHEPY